MCMVMYIEGRAYPESHEDPEAARADAVESSAQLARYIREHRVEHIYSCWSGDKGEPQESDRRITPEDLIAADFVFREREMLTIDHDAS